MLASKKIRFVLINTTHPGNIGASARAIKNMGFEQLYLVAPANYPHQEAYARSSGAEDILDNAVIVDALHEAIHDCTLVIGTSARERSLPLPLYTPREFVPLAEQAITSGGSIAVLFGQERTGLTNDELSQCHYHLSIPCNESFAALNVAAALQIIAYELHIAFAGTAHIVPTANDCVSIEEMNLFYEHLERTLIRLEFLDPNNPRQLMRKLRRLFNRIHLEANEMNILRGILTMVNKKLDSF